jgi:hypothetical protein
LATAVIWQDDDRVGRIDNVLLGDRSNALLAICYLGYRHIGRIVFERALRSFVATSEAFGERRLDVTL